MNLRIVLFVLLAAACGEPRLHSTDPGEELFENSDSLCSNGIDDDGNGFADCDDLACQQGTAVSVCRQGAEASQLLCHDTQDNDNDGQADCADPDCESFGCFETSDSACTNGEDDDGDNFADCDDFDCLYGCNVTVCGVTEKSEADCTDGVDNDGDNHADCDDFGCRDCVVACQAGLGENSVALCSDSEDNDGDGGVDCRDTECWQLAGVTGCNTGAENSAELCADGIDNDNDPFIDCADRNCAGLGSCVENDATLCADGADNDGDGYADCQDFDCSGLAGCGETGDDECSNGLDDDGNGFTDCDDFGCRYGCGVTVCPGAEKLPAECADNADNDGDGRVDCADRGCRDCIAACLGGTGENTVALCSDGNDNDNDGGTDCRDTECVTLPGVSGCDTGAENTAGACADGQDNDNDPWIDCADRNCRGIGACVENSDALCADALDNDSDGFTDCDDFDCSQNAQVTVCGTPLFENSGAACSDGQDNDSDTFIDCDDRDCSGNPALDVCPAPIPTTIERLQDRSRPDAVVIPTGATVVRVRLTGVTVTTPVLTDRSGRRTFFVQEAFPPADTRWHGIEVFAGVGAPEVRPGDVIDLVGFYTEYFGLSQIIWGRHSVTGTAVSSPTQIETQQLTSALAEPYEGVLLEVGTSSNTPPSVRVVATAVASRGGATPENNDFSVLEASASATLTPLVIGTHFAPRAPAVGERFGYIRGPLTYTWSMYRLAPRVDADYGPADVSLTDSDGDGLPDADEIALGTSPALRDSDADGEEDLPEVRDATAPGDSDCDDRIDAVESSTVDADGDGVADELDPFDADGPDGDPDGDGIKNAADPNDDGDSFCDPHLTAPVDGDCTELGDNCPTVAGVTQDDMDHDGRGDGCDADIDGDGLCNGELCLPVADQCTELGDNCRDVANVSQLDSDADGQGDLCDPDDDGDGVCDPNEVAPGECTYVGLQPDNCPLLANADQKDNDADLRGDACDADDDNDGVCDPGVQEGSEGCIYVGGAADNCALTHNPDQLDSDGDGIGDVCEVVATPPAAGEILINEVLADPVGAGDANGDGGVPSATSDELVELVNVSGRALDLSGCEIHDGTTIVRHIFDGAADPTVYVVGARSGVVVFGGGTPTGSFAAASVFVASSGGLGLNNDGDTVSLVCASAVISTMTYGAEGNTNQSLTRSPDAAPTGTFVGHRSVAATPYSPGACADGAPFSACVP